MKEAEVLKQIRDYLAAKRIFNFRLSTGSFFFEDRAFRAHLLGQGAADIVCPPPGTVWIEVKNEKGQQTFRQKAFEELVKGYGHKYVLARSIDDLQGIF